MATPLCQHIQTTLGSVFDCNDPQQKRDRLGYLDALISGANTGEVQMTQLSANGKRRQVELIYLQRGLESAVADVRPDSFCDAEDEPLPKSTIIDVERWVHRKIKLTEAELQKFCYQSTEQFLANAIRAEMNAILTAVNKDLLLYQGTNFGKFADGEVVKVWAPLTDVDFAPNYFAESQALEEFALISGCGRPFVIGAGQMSHYARMSAKGCCNAGTGIDRSMGADFLFFHDKYVNTVLGGPTENYIMLAPGAVQLATWNANPIKTEEAWIDGKDESSTLMDPLTGILFDFDKVFDKCSKTYNLTLSLNYQPVFLPSDSFAATDPLYGVNYTLHYTNA